MKHNKMPKSNEVKILKAAALEWRGRLQAVHMRQDAIWNAAVHDCMERFGRAHEPQHRNGECARCWTHNKLRGALRLEASGYVPIKERMRASLEHIKQECRLRGPERQGYMNGLSNMIDAADRILEDFE